MRAVHGPWVKIPSRAISVFCWKILGNIKSILVIIKKTRPVQILPPPHLISSEINATFLRFATQTPVTLGETRPSS